MFEFFKDKFNNLKETVSNTAQVLVGNIVNSVENEEEFSEFVLDDMEDLLISADLGVNYAAELVDKLRLQDKIKPSDVKNYLKEEFLKTLKEAGDNKLGYKENELNIYFITGVNGVGKTTLIAKLAYKFKNEGKKVLLVAGDTFRAGAIEQIIDWGKQTDCPVIYKENADPASVVFEGITKAKNEDYDVVLVDTAGRLQNKVNLMKELEKINKVISNIIPEAPHETLLVIDATTGQNGIRQAKSFKEITNITGIVLTKLDGTAKGGIVLAIKDSVNIPVKYVGLGEKYNDFSVFDIEKYIYGLFKDMVKNEE